MAEDARARGWALKAECYAAWHTAPPHARAAADRLRALADEQEDPELQALADWTDGIAHLADGALTAALVALESAHAAFTALGDLQHAAESQVPQMVALSMLGRDAEAVQRAQSALAQFVASGDTRSAAKIDGNLGTMLSRQDRHTEAEQHWRRAAVRFARVGDTELSVAADVALANTLTWQFRFDEALRINERARMRARTHGFTVLDAHARQAIGRIELNRGRWHQALPALAEAARLLAEAGAPPQKRIEAEAALADAYLAVNLLGEAVSLYDRVMADALALQAPTEQAWAALQRARALDRLGDARGAAAGLSAARALYAGTGNTATMAFIDLCRGRVELGAGDAASALGHALAAQAALQGSGITGWLLEARALQAAAHAALGEDAAAQAGFDAVLAQAGGLPQIALPCHVGLGSLALARGKLDTARDALETALDLIDRERAALPDDDFRSALGAEAEHAHDLLVRVALAQGDAVQLLRDLERGRARALALSLPAADAAPRAAASAQLRWLRDQWRQALAEGDEQRLPALGGQVQALEHELLEAHRREALLPTGAKAATEEPLDLAALQASLPEDTAIVVWHQLNGRLLACVVAGGEVRHHAWAADGLAERIRALRFQIDTLRFGGAGMRRHAGQLMARAQVHARALHDLVWAPVEPLLGGRRRVVLVPHRELHYLPFGALHDGRQWLVQSHRLSLAPSATVWQAQQRRPAARFDSVLAVGVGGTALPQVAGEIAAVSAAFGPRAQVLCETGATQPALTAALPAADVLHLACHGHFRSDNPAFSFLQLGDGPLTLRDARELPLRASLVALSACETGVSRVAPGDEVLGLVRAFMLAGAGAVLATLWPVEDAACAALMTDFYRGLLAGASPADALNQAQASAAASGAHPFFWAAFSLHGRG
jgi:CHAT domain-containing protein